MSIYVISDLHGQLNIWHKIKEKLQPTDKVIFLGDAVDRGDRGFELFMELLDDARVTYLKGNHEELMYYAFMSEDTEERNFYFNEWTKEDNGGMETLMNIRNIDLDFNLKMDYIKKIKNMPSYATYTASTGDHIILCHAGFTPGEKWDKLSAEEKGFQFLWDREHFKDAWPAGYDNTYIIHGHTPLQLMMKDGILSSDSESLCVSYANNHKICLDVSTAFSGAALMFNLTTWSIELIQGE